MKENDHRVFITKTMIRKAFTELLNEKPLESISIKELCEKASINRGTFYNHYTDIYDLLNKIESEMIEQFKLALKPLLDVPENDISAVKITSKVFQILKENADICTMTLGKYGDKSFAIKLTNLGRDRCIEAYTKYFKNASQKQIEYFYSFVSSGCIGLLQKWLNDGMTADSEEIAKTAESIMLSGMGFLAK